MTLNRRSVLTLLAAAPLSATFVTPALAALPKIYTNGGAAINGIDTLEYFKSQRPVKGDPQLAHYWKDAKWLFATMDNLQEFAANPAKFVPQYGGYCAYAVSRGGTASSAPDAWTVYKGKLYLNQSQAVRTRWKKDIPGNISKADGYWPGVLS